MKKILSLDGGGIRGIIPATILAYIEKRTGKNIAEMFDLIAGTSSGGLIAMGLCKGDAKGRPVYSARHLADFYINRGNEIFSKSLWKKVTSVGGMINEKYPHQPLENALDDIFKKSRLADSITRTLISCYDIENRKPFFFKSWKKESNRTMMKRAARATSAAPTYFEPARITVGGKRLALIDGGVYINNPAMSAYSEAKKLFPRERSMLIVSIGSGKATRRLPYEDAKNWGLLEWARPVLSIISDGVSTAVDYQLKQNLGDNFIRLQVKLKGASDDIDNTSEKNIEALKQGAGRLINSKKAVLNHLCDLLVSK